MVLDLDVVEQRIQAGDSVDEIAAAFGVAARTIRNQLHRAGRPLASEVLRNQRRGRLNDAEWLRSRYVTDAVSPSAIAEALQTTTDEVNAALQAHGIIRPPRRPGLTREALLHAFATGETVSSIARREGIDRHGVRRAMRHAGVTNPRPAARPRPAVLDDPVWLRDRYERDNWSLVAIAKECGSSISTVRRSLHRHGIELRTPNSQPPGQLDREWLQQRYDTGARMVDIAAEAGVSRGLVARAIRWHEIPPRSPKIVHRKSQRVQRLNPPG